MTRSPSVLALVLVLLSTLAGRETSTAQEASTDAPSGPDTIVIYGRPTCHNCASLEAALDSAGIAYTFYDIDVNPAYADEMWRKIDSVTTDTESLMLPVVDVNGTILVTNPTTLAELEPYLHAR